MRKLTNTLVAASPLSCTTKNKHFKHPAQSVKKRTQARRTMLPTLAPFLYVKKEHRRPTMRPHNIYLATCTRVARFSQRLTIFWHEETIVKGVGRGAQSRISSTSCATSLSREEDHLARALLQSTATTRKSRSFFLFNQECECRDDEHVSQKWMPPAALEPSCCPIVPAVLDGAGTAVEPWWLGAYS